MRRLMGLAFVAAAAAFICLHAIAQAPPTIHRIGFLGGAPQLEVFKKALADLGYKNDRDVTIVARWPEGGRLNELPSLASELVALKVDIVFAVGATAAKAAKGATADMPIVFAGVVDPLATGFVTSIERPGGNLTGATTFDPRQPLTQLEILKEINPHLKRVALLGDSEAPLDHMFQTNETAARSLGLEAIILKVRAVNPGFDGAFNEAKKAGCEAVVILSTPVTTPNRRRIAEAAINHRVPILSPLEHADAGGLISFGTGFSQATRRAAMHVDKILKGAKPGELPIDTVRQHELVINLKAAREIGLALPSTVLSRANQIIQ